MAAMEEQNLPSHLSRRWN